MPALTSSGVTVNNVWYEGESVGSRVKVLDVTLALVAQGGLTNNIPAALLGFQTVTEADSFRTSASVAQFAGPSFDGLSLAMFPGATGIPTDITATVRGNVRGKE